MTNLVEFPGLGLEFELNRVAFKLFGIEIYWYGVLIGTGMVLALVYAFSQCKRFGIDGDRMADVVYVGFAMAIICGRLYYIIFDDQKYTSFWQIINLRLGGIAIYGGIIGAFLGAWFMCRIRKVPLMPMFDLTAMGFLIGQGIGRWGNFFNQEAFGSNTNLPWGMISPSTSEYLNYRQQALAAEGIMVDPYMPVHPTFLYESIWCLLGFLLLHLYRKHRKFNGEIFLFYVIWYGAGRFIIEGLRTDSLMMHGIGLRVSQVLAGLSALAALAIWIAARAKTAGKPLVVPALPPKEENVRVDTADGVKTVKISWPAEQPVPNLESKRQMALAVLEKEKQNETPPESKTEKGENQQGKTTKQDGEKPEDEQPEQSPKAETKPESQPKVQPENGVQNTNQH